MLPQADVARVRRLCEGRVPDHVLDEVRVELEERPRTLTIVECRAPWREDYRPDPVARLSYTSSQRAWTLYYCRSSGRWERYPLLSSTTRIDVLLDEIDRDPICVFWG